MLRNLFLPKLSRSYEWECLPCRSSTTGELTFDLCGKGFHLTNLLYSVTSRHIGVISLVSWSTTICFCCHLVSLLLKLWLIEIIARQQNTNTRSRVWTYTVHTCIHLSSQMDSDEELSSTEQGGEGQHHWIHQCCHGAEEVL